MNFHTQNVSKKHFFIEWGCVPIRARASAKHLPPIQMKKKGFFQEDLALKNHVAKSQGIYLESRLILADMPILAIKIHTALFL